MSDQPVEPSTPTESVPAPQAAPAKGNLPLPIVALVIAVALGAVGFVYMNLTAEKPPIFLKKGPPRSAPPNAASHPGAPPKTKPTGSKPGPPKEPPAKSAATPGDAQ